MIPAAPSSSFRCATPIFRIGVVVPFFTERSKRKSPVIVLPESVSAAL